MAPCFGRREAVGFAWGLIGFAWVALILIGPLALFFTWYGDCFSETCPSPTAVDGAIYRLDVVAVAVIALISAIAFLRPSRVWFGLIGLIGLAYTAEAVAGILGYRGLYAFGLLLPAGVLMATGGIAGVRALADRPLPGMEGPASMAAGVGCATIAISFVALIVLPAIVHAVEPIPLVATFVTAGVVVAAIVVRRRRAGDPAPTRDDADVPGEGR